MYHHHCNNKYMKQNRARDGKDAAAGASASDSGPKSGGLRPPELPVLSVPGGDRDVGVLGVVDVEPADPDCPAVLQTRITMINMILFQQ